MVHNLSADSKSGRIPNEAFKPVANRYLVNPMR